MIEFLNDFPWVGVAIFAAAVGLMAWLAWQTWRHPGDRDEGG